MNKTHQAEQQEARQLTGQERIFALLQRLENTISCITETVFGPQEVPCTPEALRETIGIVYAVEQFIDRLDAGLDVACNNLLNIQFALERLPNQGYKGLAK